MTSVNISNAEHLGVTLKGIRKAMGLTQNEFSNLIKMNQSCISKIEVGVTEPTIATLVRIADAIGKDLIVEFKERKDGDVHNSSMD